MKQFTGTLLLQQLKDKECFQLAPVVMMENGTGEWRIGTLSHRSTDGYWAIDIPGEESVLCTETFSLHTLRVRDEEGIYNVESKQWKKVISLAGGSVEFTKKPLPYKTGFYHQECASCGKDFTAAKHQSRCEDCCKVTGTAIVTTRDIEKPKQSIKLTSFSRHQIGVVNDFLKERIDSDWNFEDWLIRKYGSNSIKR